ncbi:UNVERIFIED_CONTAM: hypothetical protein O8I53_07680 [Campylobacter lari]
MIISINNVYDQISDIETKEIIFRQSIYLGFKLAVDVVYLIYYLFRLFALFSRD